MGCSKYLYVLEMENIFLWSSMVIVFLWIDRSYIYGDSVSLCAFGVSFHGVGCFFLVGKAYICISFYEMVLCAYCFHFSPGLPWALRSQSFESWIVTSPFSRWSFLSNIILFVEISPLNIAFWPPLCLIIGSQWHLVSNLQDWVVETRSSAYLLPSM